MPDTTRKNGNVTLTPCRKVDDAKYSFSNGAIIKKIFQWNLQISGWRKRCKKDAYKHNWRAQEAYFSWLCFCVPLSNSCLPPRAGSIVSKHKTIFRKKCWKHVRHKESGWLYTKLTKLPLWCLHPFSPTGLWGRKTHGTAARSNILNRARSEKMAIGTATRAKIANQMTKNTLIEAVWRWKK